MYTHLNISIKKKSVDASVAGGKFFIAYEARRRRMDGIAAVYVNSLLL